MKKKKTTNLPFWRGASQLWKKNGRISSTGEREREREERVSGEATGKDVRECGCSKFWTLDINTSLLSHNTATMRILSLLTDGAMTSFGP